MTAGHHKSGHARKLAENRGFFPLVLVAGVVLFVVGFVMTVSALSDMGSVSTNTATGEAAGSTSSSVSLTLLVGLMMSLSGLVLATAGPAAFFIINRRNAGRVS